MMYFIHIQNIIWFLLKKLMGEVRSLLSATDQRKYYQQVNE